MRKKVSVIVSLLAALFLTATVLADVDYSVSVWKNNVQIPYRVDSIVLGNALSDGGRYDRFFEFWKGGDYTPVFANNVDSLVFNEQSDLQIAVTDEYIEGFTSMLISDGRFILSKPDSLNEYFFMLGCIDAKGTVAEELGVCVKCDSLDRPIVMKCCDKTMFFTNYSSESFDLEVVDESGIQSYKGVNFKPYTRQQHGTKSSTSKGGFLDTAGKILSILDAGAGLLKGGTIGLSESLFETMTSGSLPEPLDGLTSAGLGIYGVVTGSVALGVSGWAIGTMSAMRGAARWKVKQMIGDITPTMLYAELIGLGEVEVCFSVSGVNKSEYAPFYSVRCWNTVTGEVRQIGPKELDALGGEYRVTTTISGLSSGKWGFKVIVYPSLFNDHPLLAQYYSFDTETAYVTIPRMDIKSAAQIWENHDTDPVQFQVRVIVGYPSEIDKTAIQYNTGYGICVTQDGKKDYYPSTENQGTGSSEEYLIPVNIRKSKFGKNKSTGLMEYNGEDIIFQTYFHSEGYIQYGEEHTVSYSYHDGVCHCPDDNHPHAIDLGLPSGTKWCCCNVGASSPEGYGGYYAWGETSEKSVYNEVTYKYCTGTDTDGDGWYESNWSYQNIGSDIVGTSYDVARVKMGGTWRMPSFVQIKELINNCSRQWTQQNGVNGILVTGPNGGQIFLPAAGHRRGGRLGHEG